MPWVFVGEGVQPFVGIGPGPLTNAEFKEAVAAYEAQFEDGEGSVRKSGLYKLVNAETAEELAEAATPDPNEAEPEGQST